MTGTMRTAKLAYDPQAEKVSGNAHLVNTSVPLSSLLGTFRDANIKVDVDGDRVHAVVGGKLGEGTVDADATLALAGATPKAVRATVTLKKVSPLGAIRPKVDAQIKTDDIAYDPAAHKWTGTVAVTNADASVSLKFADDLFAVGQPDDMVFVDAAPSRPRRSTSRSRARRGSTSASRSIR